jgi:hypothetical protein
MDRRFAAFTLGEFSNLLGRFPFSRRIEAVHVHHTWRPNHAQWAGEPSVLAMWRFHTRTNGWSDIAQHVTIAPDGLIWEGRDWNRAPASASGHNGTGLSGPFMFEVVGDFDAGCDPLAGEQRASVVGVIARLLHRFGLDAQAVRFHREMTHLKTCPGTSVHLDDIRAEVDEARATLPGASPVRSRSRSGRATRPDGSGGERLEDDPPDAEPAESLMSEEEWRRLTVERPSPRKRPARRKRPASRKRTAGRKRTAAAPRARGKKPGRPRRTRARSARRAGR